MAVRGQRYDQWTARAVLSRTQRHVALTFLDDPTRDKAMQRADWLLVDTEMPLIFVAQTNIANDLQNESIFSGRARVIGRQRSGTPEAIMEAAESITQAA